MKKLEVGMVVNVYGAGYRYEGPSGSHVVPGCTEWKGKIADLDIVRGKIEQVLVEYQGKDPSWAAWVKLWVHPKQVRLVRKERRRLWVQIGRGGRWTYFHTLPGAGEAGAEIVEFVEVKRRARG